MAFHIRDEETDALVRELARKEKVGLKDAVKDAVREKLKALDAKPSLHERLSEIADEIARASRTGKKADKKFFDTLSGN
ncbi:MAG TPA: type II toxin-antitoxin system VapB family antitoxin [Rhizomicrobium sp.]|jgi:antitoxin VapB|nr:type II toxin-antitoxin system VapB family antitoxin [Rhizomicrobium sp.]